VASIVWRLRTTLSGMLDGQIAGVVHAPPKPQRFWEECVGIVTPHRAQRALVVREFTKLFPGEVALIDEAVDTVERVWRIGRCSFTLNSISVRLETINDRELSADGHPR
jgi:hypothetical protein